MKVFLDTNVLVSAFTTRGICTDIVTVVLTEHELIIGETVLAELSRVLGEKMKVDSAIIDEAVALLREEGTAATAEPGYELEAIRDPDDRLVVREALAEGADVLVSGDLDLLDVSGELPVQVVSPRGFWEMLHGEG